MAKNNSFVKLQGTLDGLTFYKSNGQNLVKTKGGVPKSRIKNDKAFTRTRENNSEFGGCANSGKAFRDAFAGVVKLMRDSLIVTRVTSIMKKIQVNGVGPRGEREINIEGYGYMFNGFELNSDHHFGTVFFAPMDAPVVSATRDSLQWKVLDFNTDTFINAPTGATHFKLILAGGLVSNYQYQPMMEQYEPVNPEANAVGAVSYSAEIPLGGMVGGITTLEVDLSAVGTVPVSSMLIGCVGILFFQQVNTSFYEFAQGNAMKVAVVG